MDRQVIPFVPANFRSFIGLIFGFGALGIVINSVQLYLFRYWQAIITSARLGWGWLIMAPYLKIGRFYKDTFIAPPTTNPRQDEENQERDLPG